MKLKVIQDGVYPGNRNVLARRLKGEDVPDDECQWVRVKRGQTLDAAKLDRRVVKSLLDNGMVEEVGGDDPQE